MLRHLDGDVLRENAKPFFGYSDNTNLLIYLWNLGIVGYHGAAVMVELGRGGRMNPLTEASLRAALFTHDEFELTAAETYNDVDRPWDESGYLESEPAMLARQRTWTWHGPQTVVTGPAWGGCLEILDFSSGRAATCSTRRSTPEPSSSSRPPRSCRRQRTSIAC